MPRRLIIEPTIVLFHKSISNYGLPREKNKYRNNVRLAWDVQRNSD